MITKKIFNDLAIFMMGFGVMIGLVFPFFVLITGTPASYVLTPLFFILCTLAGIIVGLFNLFLSRKIVGSKIKQLSTQMKKVEHRLLEKSSGGDAESCSDSDCYIAIQSDDEIGESGRAFNSLVESLANAFKSEEAVRSFTEMLSTYLELDKLAEESLTRLIANMAAEGGAVLIEKDGELEVLSSYRINTPESLLKSEIIWSSLSQRKRMIIDIPDDVVLNGLIVNFKPKSVLVQPIIYKEIGLGVIVLAGTTLFTQEMQNQMDMFSNGLALAFRNAITYNQLQRLAANDPLTGILNRRFGTSRFKEEFARSIRYNMPIGVLMFDIDHFKKINDTYGHIVGDKVLIHLAQTVKLALREGDVFFRYGGEEFVVVLPGASQMDVKKTAEQIRHLTEDMEIRHNSQVIKITISIGGTSYPERDVADIDALISYADAKMYQAKESGRNNSIID